MLQKTLSYLVPKPCTGSIWTDLFYLMLVIVLQMTVIPSLFQWFPVDIVTPWLAYSVVMLTTSWGMTLSLLGALILENHSAVPAGFYICTYWIMATLIVVVKNHISWFNAMPWFTTFVVCQLWLVIFESFVYIVKTSHFEYFDLGQLGSMLARVTSSVLLGLWIANANFARNVEERSR